MRIQICALIVLAFFLIAGTAPRAASGEDEDKLLSGMSVVGNDEAPKSLVIVPWKSSELGDALEVSQALHDERKPVDRDVFQRELDYYRIRSGGSK